MGEFTVQLDGESEVEVVFVSERKNSPDPPAVKNKKNNPTVKFQDFYDQHNLTSTILTMVVASKG